MLFVPFLETCCEDIFSVRAGDLWLAALIAGFRARLSSVGALAGFLTALQASLQQTTSFVFWCVNNGEHDRLPLLKLQVKRVGQKNYVHACIIEINKNTDYLTSAFGSLLACLLLSITVREMQLASFFASSVPMYCC